jgi:hypothetical protein
MSGLQKEFYSSMLVKVTDKFWNRAAFLGDGKSMTDLVKTVRDQNAKDGYFQYINFPIQGGRPTITKNFRTNGTTTLSVYDRVDTPERIGLENYSTQQIMMPSVDLYTLAYNKWGDMLDETGQALTEDIAKEGIWKIAPPTNVPNKLPVFNVASTNPVLEDGKKSITEADIMKLRNQLNVAYPALINAPWVLMVDTYSFSELVKNSNVLQQQQAFKGLYGKVNSDLPAFKIWGFEIREEGDLPYYGGLVKKALGSVPILADSRSAVAYVKQKTYVVARGMTQTFSTLNDAGRQADFVSFLTRAYIGPFGENISNLMWAGAILRTP